MYMYCLKDSFTGKQEFDYENNVCSIKILKMNKVLSYLKTSYSGTMIRLDALVNTVWFDLVVNEQSSFG